MLIRNVTRAILDEALAKVSAMFDGNVQYKACEYKGKTRQGGEKWQVTLRPVKCRKGNPGVRLGQQGLVGMGVLKHIAASCWHVHGYFFDALPKYVHTDDGMECPANVACAYLATRAEVSIVVGRYGNGSDVVRPGDEWNDYNIHNKFSPIYASEACDCGELEPVSVRVYQKLKEGVA